MTVLPLVDVAVCIVRDGDGRVLLAQRTARQTAAGFWELPGGKIDPGETAQAAAARELKEEVGVDALALRRWIAYEHAFATKRVRLQFFQIDSWQGTPHGREGQRLTWADPAAPHVAPLLPSNERVMHGLGLPSRCLVARSADYGGPEALLNALRAAFASGVRMLQLHEPAMTPDGRATFARRVESIAREFDARVLLQGSSLEARRAGVSGVHSPASELRRLMTRPQVRLWSASCHTQGDLERAVALGADVALLSPVLSSRAHPGPAPLGWDGFAQLAARAPMPVFAQGGLDETMLSEAVRHGAAGVAVNGASCGRAVAKPSA